MSSKFNTFETYTLSLILQNVWAGYDIGGGGTSIAASSTPGSVYIALFTSSPLDDESGIANECNYGGYGRIGVARSSSAWSVVDNVGSNISAIVFTTATSGPETASHFAVCTGGTRGVADILYHGSITTPLTINTGVTPQIAPGGLTITED